MATVIQKQTFLDLAIQEKGSADAAIALAIANGKSVTDDLVPGTTINAENVETGNSQVLAYIVQNGMRPASATQNSVVNPETLEGIGYWEIGINSKVS